MAFCMPNQYGHSKVNLLILSCYRSLSLSPSHMQPQNTIYKTLFSFIIQHLDVSRDHAHDLW